MAHHGFLIAIFVILTLVVPAVVAMRVFSTTLSDERTKSSSEGDTNAENSSERDRDSSS